MAHFQGRDILWVIVRPKGQGGCQGEIMCGRYAAYSNAQQIAKIFGIRQPFNLENSYNVAPTENISVICKAADDDERRVVPMRWGLIPSWLKEPQTTSVLINARFETIASKPSFRTSASRRRCLIIADGFYEWRKTSTGERAPYFIQQKNRQPFALAGIWDRWVGDGRTIDSCCIITLDANPLLAPLHNRMPAIVKPDDYDAWLDRSNQNWEDVKALLTNEPHDNLMVVAVSNKVNNARYKGEDCILPVQGKHQSD